MLHYDMTRWDLVAAARTALLCGELALEDLARLPEEHAARGSPPVHRALVDEPEIQAPAKRVRVPTEYQLFVKTTRPAVIRQLV